jgi:hypothetical protein
VVVERRHGGGEVLAAKIFDARARERGRAQECGEEVREALGVLLAFYRGRGSSRKGWPGR